LNEAGKVTEKYDALMTNKEEEEEEEEEADGDLHINRKHISSGIYRRVIW
jgi:hypothetical protein